MRIHVPGGVGLLLVATMTHAGAATSHYAEIAAEGWHFSPVLQNQKVAGLFAWLDESLARGQNIRAVYITRGSNGRWETRAWENATIEEAEAYVQLTANGAAQFDPSDFSTDPLGPCDFSSVPQAPVVLVNGMFPNDPNQPTVQQSNDKEALLRRYAMLGYIVAPSISEMMVARPVTTSQGSVAKLGAFVDELAAKVEIAVYGQTDLTQAGLWPCTCTITYGTPTCGPWTFVCSVPAAGGTTCHYERTCTRTWTASGKVWYCASCADSGTETYTQTGRTTVIAGDPCVPPDP